MNEKKDKIKEALGKIGQATLPAMMLLGMAWNANATAMSTTELSIRAKDTEQKTPPVIKIAEDYERILVKDHDWNFSEDCRGGCTNSCGGCTGQCTGCSSGCTSVCTGCQWECTGSK